MLSADGAMSDTWTCFERLHGKQQFCRDTFWSQTPQIMLFFFL
jgi:hypothetical protein